MKSRYYLKRFHVMWTPSGYLLWRSDTLVSVYLPLHYSRGRAKHEARILHTLTGGQS